MIRNSIPLEECVALAYRVSGGDCSFVKYVRIDPHDKHCRYFDSIHALARCLVREMEAAGHVVRGSSGDYRLAYPNNGRFQPLKKMLESDWLPQAQELSLVEYLEKLFVKERGTIRREEIEQINLALIDVAHRANGNDAAAQTRGQNLGDVVVHVVKGNGTPARNTGKPNGKARKRERGRKPKYTPAQLEALKLGTFDLLDEYGDPDNNPHPELRSITALIDKLQEWAVIKKPKDFPKEPARSTIQSLVNEWLEEWRMRAIAS
jgi:hypothetical protein